MEGGLSVARDPARRALRDAGRGGGLRRDRAPGEPQARLSAPALALRARRRLARHARRRDERAARAALRRVLHRLGREPARGRARHRGDRRQDLAAAPTTCDAAPPGTLATHETTDGDHGRIEVRRSVVSHDVAWIASDRRFPGAWRFPDLALVGMTAGPASPAATTSPPPVSPRPPSPPPSAPTGASRTAAGPANMATIRQGKPQGPPKNPRMGRQLPPRSPHLTTPMIFKQFPCLARVAPRSNQADMHDINFSGDRSVIHA